MEQIKKWSLVKWFSKQKSFTVRRDHASDYIYVERNFHSSKRTERVISFFTDNRTGQNFRKNWIEKL